MNEDACAELLAWLMPMLGLRYRGFSNVRRQVCRRVTKRARERGCADFAAYRAILEAEPAERAVVDRLCFVTISRFYRDGHVFGPLAERLLPDAAAAAEARGERSLRVWSAGCASGEEPYSVAIVWHHLLAARFPSVSLDLVATDRDEAVLRRARDGVYAPGSLREMPGSLAAVAFEEVENGLRVRGPYREGVRFVQADIRTFEPGAPLHVALCRNSAFTYFADEEQRRFAQRLAQYLVPRGIVVLGNREAFPSDAGFEPCAQAPYVHCLIPPARPDDSPSKVRKVR